jgi:hypothetical protein
MATVPHNARISGANWPRSSTTSTPKKTCKYAKDNVYIPEGMYISKGKYIEYAKDSMYFAEGKCGKYAMVNTSAKKEHNEPLTKEDNV